jgi:hypothetical protein
MTNESEAFMTHFEDQQKAAADHAERFAEQISQQMKFFKAGVPDKVEISDFTTTYIGSKYKWFKAPDGYEILSCKHVDPMKPEIMYNGICEPEVVGCIECIRKRISLFNKKHPKNCDFCFRVDDVFVESVFQIGYCMIFGNLCMSCHDKQIQSQSADV